MRTYLWLQKFEYQSQPEDNEILKMVLPVLGGGLCFWWIQWIGLRENFSGLSPMNLMGKSTVSGFDFPLNNPLMDATITPAAQLTSHSIARSGTMAAGCCATYSNVVIKPCGARSGSG